MSNEKESNKAGIESSPAYNTRTQRAASQKIGGKSVVDEKDQRIDDLISRLTTGMNLISKLSTELENKTRAEKDMNESIGKLKKKLEKAKEKINKLENKVSLEQRQNRMLKARMLETSWARKLEHFRQRTRNLRARWKTCKTDLDNERLKNLELTKKLDDSNHGAEMMMLVNLYDAGFDDLDPNCETQLEPSRMDRIRYFIEGLSMRSPNKSFVKGMPTFNDDFVHEFSAGQRIFLKDDRKFASIVEETKDEV